MLCSTAFHIGPLAVANCNAISDDLRQLKSQIEGTYFKFQPIQLDSEKLVQLKHLAVAYTPATLQEHTKAKIAEKLTELFQGQVKKVVYACILTCPWFAHTQSEVSAQAKNNVLFMVFVASDEQFFTLATPHERELCETVDEARKLPSSLAPSLSPLSSFVIPSLCACAILICLEIPQKGLRGNHSFIRENRSPQLS